LLIKIIHFLLFFKILIIFFPQYYIKNIINIIFIKTKIIIIIILQSLFFNNYYYILNGFETEKYHYPIVKAPNPSVIAFNNFCFSKLYEVYGDNFIQFILIK